MPSPLQPPALASGPAGAVSCPALLVSAPASGQGKTTATAALARWHVQQGRRVRVFKTGPDFLDPMVLERASGHPVLQLDLWMGGEAHCRRLLWEAAQQADVILVEGVMGLHDGNPSSADLALTLGLPVLAVIDAASMAQTFGALALGLAQYRPGLQVAGVLANRVGSTGHAQMLQESLPQDMAWFGGLPRDEALQLPSRHLGLVQADEVADIEARLDRAAQALGAMQPAMPAPVQFLPPPELPEPEQLPAGQPLAGVRVAVARDEAFAFVYPANLQVLRALGAEVQMFSPLHDAVLPEADALYLPGGYPELHAKALAARHDVQAWLKDHVAAGKPLVAECGGMLALIDGLTPHEGERVPMWGLLAGEGTMRKRLVNLGLHDVALPEGVLRGHTFHHAAMDSPLSPAGTTRPRRLNGQPEAVWRHRRLLASFLHLYFPSNPSAVAALFGPGVR
ncbi:cobyrinate a,c-diamide synthase [Aquabacterium lacunae]|uniref:Cobyrinate a,c-diamide synthase n=1 Tax=Aquabacterium lacunae TaxID=2528630 RepID=A0A4Q9H530_9BURK|nr:cobyrinate a,c-diamide synthase [Aquabacterium lacunae]